MIDEHVAVNIGKVIDLKIKSSRFKLLTSLLTMAVVNIFCIEIPVNHVECLLP